MNTRSFFGLREKILVIFTSIVLGYLSGAAHAKLVVTEEIPLTSTTGSNATIQNKGGEFTAQGWKSTAPANYLHVQLSNPVKAGRRGAIELHVTNFDLARNLPGHISNFFGIYESPAGEPVAGTPGMFVVVQVKGKLNGKAGYSCTQKGKSGQGMKAMYKASNGEQLSNGGNFGCNANWDAGKVYKFRFEFNGKRAILTRDGLVLYGLTDFPRANDLAHVFLGHNKTNTEGQGSFPGVVYRKIVVYNDDGKPGPADPLMREKRIRINCGASDDQVEGWYSDVPYAYKGKEYGWNYKFNPKTAKNPAPAAVYNTIRHKNHSFNSGKVYNDSTEFRFPVADGKYTVRIHMADKLEHFKRYMDIDINGKKVINDIEWRGAAGGPYKALSRDFDVTVSNGKGILVVLYDDVSDASVYGHGDFFIPGLEIINLSPSSAKPGLILPSTSPAPRGLVRMDRSGALHVTAPCSGHYSLRITDAAGRCRVSREMIGSATIRTGLDAGWYLVQLRTGGTTIESNVLVRP